MLAHHNNSSVKFFQLYVHSFYWFWGHFRPSDLFLPLHISLFYPFTLSNGIIGTFIRQIRSIGGRKTMGINLNFWSFILSLGCILLFFLSGTIKDFFVTQLHFHPLTLTLLLSIACFYLSFVGMKDVKNLTTLLRGILTMLITLILIISISFILFFGNFLS